eukprot:TRINITY_DN13641_c0_g1_i1.p1 TRINITY_DN13641_c0_g1~~TRINITY_DN13641_c0_g1_i1.p1  ORF type:complete len:904 (+),score=177.37 TRINITY_DN13641_c0_g1_i1:37-2748(+)
MPNAPDPSYTYLFGLRTGEHIRASRDLEVFGKIIVRNGDRGVVLGVTQNRCKLVIRFDSSPNGNLNVHRTDVQPFVRWRKGQSVEATRDLYGVKAEPLVREGCTGLVLGLAPDRARLAVRFEGCAVALNVTPDRDIEHAWRMESKRMLEDACMKERHAILHECDTARGQIEIVFREENMKGAYNLEGKLSVITTDLLDESSSPQSMTGWSRFTHDDLISSDKHFRGATSASIRKILTRLEQRILDQDGRTEHHYFCGLKYFIGLGTKANFEEAVRWFKKAASGDCHKAWNMLGVVYAEDRRGIAKDIDHAMEQFSIATSLGSAAAPHNMGCILYDQGRDSRAAAIRRWHVAAGLGHVAAQYRLGYALLNSGNSTRQEAEEGLQWLKRSAAAGHAKALYCLGKRELKTETKKATELIRKAADQGLVEAQHSLGVILFCGTYTCIDDASSDDESVDTAFSGTLSKAPDMIYQDHGRKDIWPAWQGELTERLKQYTGSFTDEKKEALEWVRQAASKGYPEAQNSLALCMLHGEGCKQNTKSGMAWLRNAARQENPAAMHNLACCLFTGEGIAVNTRKALELWRKSGKQGNAESNKKRINLANWVFQGEEAAIQLIGESNSQAECELVLKVLAEKGHCDSGREAMEEDDTEIDNEVMLDTVEMSGSDMESIRKKPSTVESDNGKIGNTVMYLKRAPFTGGIRGQVGGGVVGQILEAQYCLGLQYFFGINVELDHQTAAQWFWRVADSSVVTHSGAQNVLGVCFEHGLGLPLHPKMAVHWYRKAALKGMPVAMHNLATCLFTGEGIKENKKEAVRWWTRAAEQGYSHAMFRLSLCELSGEGCRHDKAAGLDHLNTASEMGIEQATLLHKALHDTPSSDDEGQSPFTPGLANLLTSTKKRSQGFNRNEP